MLGLCRCYGTSFNFDYICSFGWPQKSTGTNLKIKCKISYDLNTIY
jgi:hypothetical protein